MKLVALSKRSPMGRDLMTRPYGRFFNLARMLSRQGHEVHLILLSYDLKRVERRVVDGVQVSAGGPGVYLQEVIRTMQTVRPDWVAGFSDTYYGIVAQQLGRWFQVPSWIDAYDNYESYIPGLKPLHHLWRRALRGAALVSAAGPGLASLMSEGREGRRTVVLPMAADPVGFVPRDRGECRRELGIGENQTCVGFCGSISRSRDIDVLFGAFELLRGTNPDIRLILSGRLEKGLVLPHGAQWLGYVSDNAVPTVINSLDVLAVVNRRTAFGDYSHPVKLYEAMACQVVVVATETPATQWILEGFEELLVPAGDEAALAERIQAVIGRRRVDYGEPIGWDEVAKRVEKILMDSSFS